MTERARLSTPRAGLSPFRFLFAVIEPGDLVEVTGGFEKRKGIEGIVTKVGYIHATVQPVDSSTLEPAGEPFTINAGLLTKQPSQTEIRAHKIKLREKHLAELRRPSGLRPGNIRVIQREDGRKRQPTKDT